MKDEVAVLNLCPSVLTVEEQLRNVSEDQTVLQALDVHLLVDVVYFLSNLNVL